MLSNQLPFEKILEVKTYDKVFLIDDDPIANFISGKFLKKNRIARKITTAPNGLAAVKLLKDLTKKENFPELIIVDINMPVMNGFEFLDYYSDNFLASFPETKVAILSSSTGFIDREKSIEYPFVCRYLVKPLDISQVNNL